jgi:hypothetical protein
MHYYVLYMPNYVCNLLRSVATCRSCAERNQIDLPFAAKYLSNERSNNT